MSTARANLVYDTLVIVAASLAREIGLADGAGHLCSKRAAHAGRVLGPGTLWWRVGLGLLHT
jgi:hypothetical protein